MCHVISLLGLPHNHLLILSPSQGHFYRHLINFIQNLAVYAQLVAETFLISFSTNIAKP